MPSVHVHATHCLLTFGRTYQDEHQQKDRPSRRLGRRHRLVNHEWYWAFAAGIWSVERPIRNHVQRSMELILQECGPDEAERYQAIYLSHDFLDRLYVGASTADRLRSEALCIFLVLHPEIIKSTYGVDVIHGRIEREIDGRKIWESSPETVRDYKRLRRYVRAVLRKRPELQPLVAAFEAEYERMIHSRKWN